MRLFDAAALCYLGCQVLCASNDAHDIVEPLAPPAEALVGERVYFGESGQNQVIVEGQRRRGWILCVKDQTRTGLAIATRFHGFL